MTEDPRANNDVDPRGSGWRNEGSKHTCHWPGCDEVVPARLWGCKRHWFTLPKVLRDRIWRHYTPGQEIAKNPSDAYLEVADDVQRWCNVRIFVEKYPAPKVVVVTTLKPKAVQCIGPIPTISGPEIHCTEGSVSWIREIING